MQDEITARPLDGIRVVEFASIGPGPHCAMLLSDLGCEVLRVDRPGGNGWPNPVIDRGRHSIEVDIRDPNGRELVYEATAHADVVIEGNRPGVMERLGYGPDELLARNPRLIYGRMTGWGQTGALATAAGHDINYIALTGALAAITGDDGRPVPPLGLVGDMGGGSLYLALGILAALLERQRSGLGQVVDAAIVDGVASLLATFSGLSMAGYSLDPDRNPVGGREPCYRCYQCADGKYVAIGAIEPKFCAELLRLIGAPDELAEQRHDPSCWRGVSDRLAAIFMSKSRAEWCAILEGTDACFAPVLNYDESWSHPHMRARGIYMKGEGAPQIAPAPRLSRTPGEIGPSGDGRALLERWSAAAG